MIGYRGEADKMLVIHVQSNGDWEELYYGDFKPFLDTVKKIALGQTQSAIIK